MSMVDERKTEPVKSEPAKTTASPTADAVREKIEKLTGGRPGGPESSKDAPRLKSPREFIQERMRELDTKKDA
jgi:hypothetical protein